MRVIVALVLVAHVHSAWAWVPVAGDVTPWVTPLRVLHCAVRRTTLTRSICALHSCPCAQGAHSSCLSRYAHATS